MITQVTTRHTRDNRRYYLVGIEDLSGQAELAVWNDVIEASSEETWAEGQIVLVSVECRERGDRLNLSARRAVPWDATEGRLIGFTPEQWQVEARRARPPRRNGRPPAVATNGSSASPPPRVPAATTEAEGPGVRSPVGGESARLIITLYETEDVMTDEALLKSVGTMLGARPGSDEVRLVIHDTDGQETEFDLERAAVTDELARSIEKVLAANKGTARLTRGRPAAAPAAATA